MCHRPLYSIAEYSGSTLVKRYVHGMGVDRPLVTYNSSSVGNTHRQFLYTNHQGSIVAAANYTGAKSYINTYDSYGVPNTNNQGRFGYTGQLYLSEIGLNYYKARIYHPKLGRFLQTDPVGYEDQMNLYAYVGNDPVNNSDPSGLTTVPDVPRNPLEIITIPHVQTNRNNCSCLYGQAAKDFVSNMQNSLQESLKYTTVGLLNQIYNIVHKNRDKEDPKRRGKKKGTNKKDKKQVNDAAKAKGVKDRKGFGEFVHKEKKKDGKSGDENYSYEGLLRLADEFLNNGGN